MPGFAVVLNPYAGENRGDHERVERFAAIVGDAGTVCAPTSLAELETAARELYARRIDVLAVCGGDGSYFRTLSAVVRAYGDEPLPRFLPLRAGSMNIIAGSVGWRHGRPERVLARAVGRYRAGRSVAGTERGLIRVNGEHYGFMVGGGAIVNFLQAYYGGKGRGPWAAARLFTRAAASAVVGSVLARGILQAVEADVDCDGERVPHRRFNLIYASSIADIGLGFRPTYLATRKREFFHLLAGRIRATHLLRRLHRLRRGWPLEIPGLYDNIAHHVRVEFPRPTHYMVDGDILDAVRQLDLVGGPRITILQA